MTELRVWAPRAEHVEIDLGDGRRIAAERDPAVGPDQPGHGWFAATIPILAERNGADPDGCVDYAFRLDNGEPLPDPRSRWQPDGVHGFSRTFDPARHEWRDGRFAPEPLQDATIYEIHIGTFTAAGTFAGVRDHLDHLVDLGITHIELMPVAAFAGRHGWGYDGVDLYAPHPAYGTPAELQQLVDDCHARGLAVLLDVVYNHLGPDGNYLARFGPYFTNRYRTPWGDAVNVDGPASDEVRRFIIDNALMWLGDYHVDGLRLDATHAIVDTSARHLLEQLREEVDELSATTGRPLVLMAELEGNDPRVITSTDQGGFGLDAIWNDDFHHALHTALTGERTSYYEDYDGLPDLVACLRDGVAYGGRWSRHRRRTVGRTLGVDPSAPGRSSVDPSAPGRSGRPGGDRLVACLQNHDQIGNRAQGERAATLMGASRQRVGAALLLTGPFVPLLFQGEDWAASSPFPYFADHDGELAAAVRKGRLAEFATFGWAPQDVTDPEDPATFAAATLRWSERASEPHAAMLDWYRTLVRLRRDHPALRDPALGITVDLDDEAGLLVIHRGPFLVAASLGAFAATVALPQGAATLIAGSDPQVAIADGHLRLPPDSVAVVRAKQGAGG